MKFTHREQFVNLLFEANVPFEERPGESCYDEDPTTTIITVENAGDVGGYRDFHTTWVFNEDGSLKGVANWE